MVECQGKTVCCGFRLLRSGKEINFALPSTKKKSDSSEFWIRSHVLFGKNTGFVGHGVVGDQGLSAPQRATPGYETRQILSYTRINHFNQHLETATPGNVLARQGRGGSDNLLNIGVKISRRRRLEGEARQEKKYRELLEWEHVEFC